MTQRSLLCAQPLAPGGGSAGAMCAVCLSLRAVGFAGILWKSGPHRCSQARVGDPIFPLLRICRCLQRLGGVKFLRAQTLWPMWPPLEGSFCGLFLGLFWKEPLFVLID